MTIGSYETVRVEMDDGIAWLYMNRLEKRNAMNPQTPFDLDSALSEVEADPETKVVILTGAGSAFCADQAVDYLAAKGAEFKQRNKEHAYANGIKKSLDDKSYKPTFGAYDRATVLKDNAAAAAAAE